MPVSLVKPFMRVESHWNNFKVLPMLAKRIIPCLDVKDGRTVKGINFEQLRDAGDPVALAKVYSDQGADELVFLRHHCYKGEAKDTRCPCRYGCPTIKYSIYYWGRNRKYF